MANQYGIKTLPAWKSWQDGALPADALAWSGQDAPPQIGEKVAVRLNGFRDCTVTGYFQEGGFLGIELSAKERPDWHKKQKPKGGTLLFFGVEISKLKEG